MPGPVSDSSKGPSDAAPYVPSWNSLTGRACAHAGIMRASTMMLVPAYLRASVIVAVYQLSASPR